MKIKEVKTLEDALKFKALVTLDSPSGGYWDGGAKSHFEFTPEIEQSPGVPAIRWGSWGANQWFVVPFKNATQHFAALRRKLSGKQPRTIKFESI